MCLPALSQSLVQDSGEQHILLLVLLLLMMMTHLSSV